MHLVNECPHNCRKTNISQEYKLHRKEEIVQVFLYDVMINMVQELFCKKRSWFTSSRLLDLVDFSHKISKSSQNAASPPFSSLHLLPLLSIENEYELML